MNSEAPILLWHRKRERPRPVYFVQKIGPQKTRVVDLVESTLHHLILRDVMDTSLTPQRVAR